ncbi:MAG TPA: FUSC family protein [Acetobacteraceae bacterium]|nr:FUSC family protein [Acetobacteraceae bacterium]
MTVSRYLPDLEGWLFSAKSFLAAIIALYIALAMGLDRPYWAMATVYIVANPLSGAIRSKAAYRLAGTLVGAAATLALVPNLVNAPELLSAALAVWIGGCLYLSLLDRTPRSYAFMLAGYTAALIGFPVVTVPDAVWNIAIARVEEITLGIVCATVVGSVVLPRPVGPVLSAGLAKWLRDADRLILDAVSLGDADRTEIAGARLRLAADAVEIRSVTAHLAYDTSRLREATRQVAALAQRMVVLLPLTAALRDRLCDLRAAGGMTAGLDAVLAQLHAWIATGAAAGAAPAGAACLRTEIATLQDQTDARRGWDGVLLTTVLVRLRELVDLRQDCLELQRHIVAGRLGRDEPKLAMRLPDRSPMYRDHGTALLRSVVAALALLTTCAFWIATAWPEGSGAAGMVAVACCFTAGRDDPVPSINGLLVVTALSAILVAIGQFVILPRAGNFEMLTIAMAAFFVPAGVLAAIPATQKLAALPVFTAVLLALDERYSADFAIWANGTGASVFGVAVAALVSALVVPSGATLILWRRLRAGWTDLAAATRSATPPERTRLVGLFLDRMGLLAPQMAMAAPSNQIAAVAAMTELRLGVNLVDLRAVRDAMPPALGAAVDAVLRQSAMYFTDCAAHRSAVAASQTLLQAIDRALDAASDMTGGSARDVVLALVGLRRNVFPDAPPYRPSLAMDAARPAPAYEGSVA